MPVTRFHTLLREKIDKARAERIESISSTALPDYAAYRQEVGYLSGLVDALALCDEVEKEFQ